MNTPMNTAGPHSTATGADAQAREQLSALVDGELPVEEARFLLRRLEHDSALSACQERWQLLGDVLRGQACAPAPVDFAERVRAQLAAEPAAVAPAAAAVAAPRQARASGWRRWGGGAALAASVAAVALFMSREQLPGPAPLDAPTTVIASQAELPAPTPTPTPVPAQPGLPVDAAVAVAAVPAAAVAASRRQDAAVRRASATRTQQAARGVAERNAEPQLAVANATLAPALPASTRALPFGDVANLHARPWPRSSLAPANGGALNASFSTPEPAAAFYPFEPRLQGTDPEAPANGRPRD